MPTRQGLILCLSIVIVCLAAGLANAQACRDCNVQSISLFTSPAVKTYQVVEMQKQIQWQQVETEVPVTRTFEEITYTQEVFDGGLTEFLGGGFIQRIRERRQERRQGRGGRVRGFNWGCLVSAFGAYSQCAMSRRGR